MTNQSRRNFLKCAALAAPTAFVGCRSANVCAERSGRPLKICVFADFHFSHLTPTNCVESHAALKRILARAEQAKCDFVIQLGDFAHDVNDKEVKKAIELYKNFSLPTYSLFGNHDQEMNGWRDVVQAFNMPNNYYSFDRGGFRFVVTDPNYYKTASGKFVHYSDGVFGDEKGSSSPWVPSEQLEWMRSVIIDSPYPCVVFSHQSFEIPPSHGGVCNKDAVQDIFREANARKPGTVRLVINGHNHCDHRTIIDNILYWDVTSVKGQWFEEKHHKYPADYEKGHWLSEHTINWKDPLSAILILWPEGRIQIEGMKSDYLFGVSPKVAGFKEYYGERYSAVPYIQDIDITLR